MPSELREHMQAQFKRVRALASEHRIAIREYLKDAGIDSRRPTDAEVIGFVAQMHQKYPPVPGMMNPDGRPVFASPWFVLLGTMQGDDEHAGDLIERFVAASVRMTTGGA